MRRVTAPAWTAILATCLAPPPPGAGAQATLVLEFTLKGTGQPEADFGRITDIEIDENGNLYVSQFERGEIEVFDPRGRHLRTMGGRGSGPGESSWIEAMGWRQGRLWASYPLQARLTFLADPPGAHEVVRFRHTAPAGLSRFNPVRPFRDGTLLSIPYPSGLAATRSPSFPEYLVRVDAEGIVLDTLAVLLGPYPGLEVPLPDGGMLVAPHPIRCRDRWAVGPEGDRLYLLRQAHLCEARRAVLPELVTIPIAGEGELVRQIPIRPQEATPRQVDAAVDGMFTEEAFDGFPVPREALRRAARRVLAVPRYLPPFSGVVAATDGSVWLEVFGIGVEGKEWVILSPDGEVLGRVRTPMDAQIRRVIGRSAWAVVKLESDVQTVARFRVPEMGPG